MKRRAFPIVGIGASAGGLEAVSRLLSHLPTDTGMAFVVVQHLDPSRESLLTGILQKTTKMPVAQAKDRLTVVPNCIYIIPPNTHMIISAGKLRLIPRPDGMHAMSVNCFLNSLAEECGNKAIAVILSGTASDGSLGIQAVKSEGGIVFAQDEQSAGFFSMPESAAATGVVDFILPPEKIAAELASIAMHPALSPDISLLFSDIDNLKKIFLLLNRGTGVDFSLYKSNTIKRRLLRRLMLHKLEKLAQYRKLLETNAEELRALHNDLLIHVTRFFREPKAMAALRARVFPRILKGLKPNATIRAWVAGCSTGEEAYSLAIALFDFLSERDCMNPVQIFATDISDIALERARAGVYTADIEGDISPRLLRRFFTKVDRGYQIVKRVRDACVFAHHDLTKDAPFSNVDVISCCNVLIYLGPTIQNRILPMFHYALRPCGALYLGSSETVGDYSDLFAVADKNSRIYYKKSAAPRMMTPTVLSRRTGASEATSAKPPVASSEVDVQKVAERILLGRYSPACVIVNGDMNILHFRGHTSRYLEPATGKANLNLLKMLPLGIAGKMSALIQKARKADAPAKESRVALSEDDSKSRLITMEAVPFRLPISGERFFIVLFEDDPPSPAGPGATRVRLTQQANQPARPDAPSVKRLKSELASTRGYLQTIVEEHDAVNEELKSANEEIISSNEELQSSNEELEVAKEELQAANEELSTVNEELQTRNTDLGLLNDDLLNLIASVHLPIVMVTNDLRIRRFSKMAEKVMNLIASDIGRPIGDINPQVSLPNIEDIIHGVIETAITKELEVRDQENHSYALRIHPYRTVDNKIAGAVLAFIDNDPILRSAHEIDDVSAFEGILEISKEAIAVLDFQMRVKTGSRSLYQDFGLTQNLLGQSLFEIAGGSWNVPALRSQLEKLAAHGVPFFDAPNTIKGRTYYFSARRIKSRRDEPPLILMSINTPRPDQQDG